MTDTVTIRRELLERLADKNASLHHTRKAQDELRAAIDSAPCDPRCAETCVRASMCATCMNALAAPVQEPLTQAAVGCFVQPIPAHCDRITWRGSYYHLPIATPPQPEAAPVGEPIRFWFIGDAGQQKGSTYCKKSSRDGSLAFFECEEDANRAALRHAGTEVYSVEYYRKPHAGAAYQRQSGVVMPERKTALNGDVLSFQSEGWNACLDEFARLNGAGSHE